MHLIDIVPDHVDRAASRLGHSGAFTAEVGDDEWFTTAYFHRPEEMIDGAGAAGLVVSKQAGVEGLAHWLKHLAERWDDDDDRDVILESARAVESEPSLPGLSPHLVTVARRLE